MAIVMHENARSIKISILEETSMKDVRTQVFLPASITFITQTQSHWLTSCFICSLEPGRDAEDTCSVCDGDLWLENRIPARFRSQTHRNSKHWCHPDRKQSRKPMNVKLRRIMSYVLLYSYISLKHVCLVVVQHCSSPLHGTADFEPSGWIQTDKAHKGWKVVLFPLFNESFLEQTKLWNLYVAYTLIESNIARIANAVQCHN